MSLEKLIAAAEQRGSDAVKRAVERIAAKPTPPGVDAEAVDGGIALVGKRLRRRMLDDPQLRNFTR